MKGRPPLYDGRWRSGWAHSGPVGGAGGPGAGSRWDWRSKPPARGQVPWRRAVAVTVAVLVGMAGWVAGLALAVLLGGNVGFLAYGALTVVAYRRWGFL